MLSGLHVPDGPLPCWQLVLRVCRELSWVYGPEHLHVGSPAQQPGCSQTSYLVAGFPKNECLRQSVEADGLLQSSFGNHMVSILPYYFHQGHHRPTRGEDIDPTPYWEEYQRLWGLKKKSLQEGSQYMLYNLSNWHRVATGAEFCWRTFRNCVENISQLSPRRAEEAKVFDHKLSIHSG